MVITSLVIFEKGIFRVSLLRGETERASCGVSKALNRAGLRSLFALTISQWQTFSHAGEAAVARRFKNET